MRDGPTSGSALLLDVDGVLIPYGPPSEEWGDWIQHEHRTDLVVSRQLMSSIDALGADVYWLTSWAHSANDVLCPFVDWPPKEVLEKKTVKDWWKLAAAEDFLASSPHGRVAWIDDDLDHYQDEVDARLGRLVDAGRLLLVSTEGATGITRHQVESVAAFFTTPPPA